MFLIVTIQTLNPIKAVIKRHGAREKICPDAHYDQTDGKEPRAQMLGNVIKNRRNGRRMGMAVCAPQ